MHIFKKVKSCLNSYFGGHGHIWVWSLGHGTL